MPVTFWKVDLLAIAKWLLSPSFLVPTGLSSSLPRVRTNSSKFSDWGPNKTKRNGTDALKVIFDISCGPLTLALVTKVQNTAKH